MMISPYPFGKESFVLLPYREKTEASLFCWEVYNIPTNKVYIIFPQVVFLIVFLYPRPLFVAFQIETYSK